MTLRKRLLLLASSLLGGLLVVGMIGLNSAFTWSSDMHKIGYERIPGLLYLADMNTERMVIRSQTLEVLTLEFEYNAQEQFKQIAQQRQNSWKKFEDSWKKFEALPRASERGRQAVAKLGEEYKSWRNIYVILDGLIDKLSANQSKNPDIQDSLMNEYKKAVAIMIPISTTFGASMVEQIDTDVGNTLKIVESATNTADKSIITTSTILIIIFVVGCFITYFIINLIITYLNKIQEGLIGFFSFINNETSKAPLIDLDSQDEFGQMASLINTNISKTEASIICDSEFIKDTTRFVNEMLAGKMLAKIEKEPTTQSLKELKSLLVQLQYYLEHTIARDLNMLLSILEKFKKEDFTARFPNPYAKVAVTINELGDVISNLLKQSLDIGKNLEQSSSVLIENVSILNTSSNSAAASLEETAAALEEITATVVSNANNVTQMSKYSTQVSQSAKKGQELAKNTTTAMEDITSQVNAINEAITVIDQIAFQTNILSLNAAVEAATAGEAGKGFAVVAAEVRNLAARSAEAAKEIKDIVERATSKANEGKYISNEMIKGYEELLDNIHLTTQTIDEIARASKEQEAGITQINDAVTGLDQQTQQNASIANETREIALKNDTIAKELVINTLKKDFLGKTK